MFWVKKDSQKQMPKIDFSKKGENTYLKTHNRLFFAYFFNRRRIWEALVSTYNEDERGYFVLTCALAWCLSFEKMYMEICGTN